MKNSSGSCSLHCEIPITNMNDRIEYVRPRELIVWRMETHENIFSFSSPASRSDELVIFKDHPCKLIENSIDN